MPSAPRFIASTGSWTSANPSAEKRHDGSLGGCPRQAVEADIGQAAGRKPRADELDERGTNGLGNPAQHAVADDVVELLAVAGIGERVADVEVDIGRGPHASTKPPAALDRRQPRGRSRPPRACGEAAAKAMRFMPSPQPISSTDAVAGSGARQPWSSAAARSRSGREVVDDVSADRRRDRRRTATPRRFAFIGGLPLSRPS